MAGVKSELAQASPTGYGQLGFVRGFCVRIIQQVALCPSQRKHGLLNMFEQLTN